MTTLNSRILDLALAGHSKDEVADLLGIADSEVQTVLQNLSVSPTPANIVTPNVTTLTVVSGTPQQDTTGEPSTVYVAITPHSGGTVAVAIGPTSGVAEAIIPTGDATLARTLSFKLPASWYFEVTVGGSAAIASALQING